MTPNVSVDSVESRRAQQYEIEQFLYREAALLDEHRFRDWLELLDDDIRYWMPSRRNQPSRLQRLERSALGEIAHFDEDKRSLTQRIIRLETSQAWAEEPPSRTRHMITNVVVDENEDATISVQCCFHTYRNRSEREVDHWIGSRQDTLRHDPTRGLLLAQRTIILDQSTLLAKNLSVFL